MTSRSQSMVSRDFVFGGDDADKCWYLEVLCVYMFMLAGVSDWQC